MNLNYLDGLILIAIHQGNGDTVPSLATSLATDDLSIEDRLSKLEKVDSLCGKFFQRLKKHRSRFV